MYLLGMRGENLIAVISRQAAILYADIKGLHKLHILPGRKYDPLCKLSILAFM